ncbi:hypothetical protein Tco_1260876 [Tanacetum coccineum]
MAEKIKSQDLEITQLKTRIKGDFLKGDTEKDSSKSTKKGSDSSGVMANVLGTLEAANILATGGLKSVFTTAGPQVPPASSSVALASATVSPTVATASEKYSTAKALTTASVTTPRVTRSSSRGVVIRSTSPIPVNIPSISKEDKGKRDHD